MRLITHPAPVPSSSRRLHHSLRRTPRGGPSPTATPSSSPRTRRRWSTAAAALRQRAGPQRPRHLRPPRGDRRAGDPLRGDESGARGGERRARRAAAAARLHRRHHLRRSAEQGRIRRPGPTPRARALQRHRRERPPDRIHLRRRRARADGESVFLEPRAPMRPSTARLLAAATPTRRSMPRCRPAPHGLAASRGPPRGRRPPWPRSTADPRPGRVAGLAGWKQLVLWPKLFGGLCRTSPRAPATSTASTLTARRPVDRDGERLPARRGAAAYAAPPAIRRGSSACAPAPPARTSARNPSERWTSRCRPGSPYGHRRADRPPPSAVPALEGVIDGRAREWPRRAPARRAVLWRPTACAGHRRRARVERRPGVAADDDRRRLDHELRRVLGSATPAACGSSKRTALRRPPGATSSWPRSGPTGATPGAELSDDALGRDRHPREQLSRRSPRLLDGSAPERVHSPR